MSTVLLIFIVSLQPYTVLNERDGRRYQSRNPPRASSAMSRGSGYDNGSDIYVTSGAYKAPSELR